MVSEILIHFYLFVYLFWLNGTNRWDFRRVSCRWLSSPVAMTTMSLSLFLSFFARFGSFYLWGRIFKSLFQKSWPRRYSFFNAQVPWLWFVAGRPKSRPSESISLFQLVSIPSWHESMAPAECVGGEQHMLLSEATWINALVPSTLYRDAYCCYGCCRPTSPSGWRERGGALGHQASSSPV